MKHYRIKKNAHRRQMFIPGVDGQLNISDLVPPTLPRLIVWKVHVVKWIVWEEPKMESVTLRQAQQPYS